VAELMKGLKNEEMRRAEKYSPGSQGSIFNSEV
jgi:hypothetical protein